MHIFTLSNKLTPILDSFDSPNKFVVLAADHESFVQKLLTDQPQFVLGLGIWNGQGKNIRIESITTNQFRKNKITPNGTGEYYINSFLPTNSTDMGVSWCNKISYLIMQEIASGELRSQYSFLHIPKGMKSSIAIKQIKLVLPRVLALK